MDCDKWVAGTTPLPLYREERDTGTRWVRGHVGLEAVVKISTPAAIGNRTPVVYPVAWSVYLAVLVCFGGCGRNYIEIQKLSL